MGHVVTIDGPAGVGKSTAARGLAGRLGWLYLDSGSLYRATVWLADHLGLQVQTPEGRRAASIQLGRCIRFTADDRGQTRLMLGTEEPGQELRSDEMARRASIVAADPQVRSSLLPVQRAVGQGGDVVAEGRDMGTVVFPDADVKFFLTADAHIRAARRVNEYESRGTSVDRESVLEEMVQRDTRDETREVSPLIPAQDAIIVDTGPLGVEEVQDVLERYIIERLHGISGR